jgi:hypothetical protein
MADPNKLAQLDSAAASKQNSLGVIKRGKQGTISANSPTPNPDFIDPNSFETIGDYEAAIGGYAPPNISNFFMERTLRNSQFAHEAANEANAKRNAAAWSTDGERYALGGQLKNMFAGAVQTTGRMGGHIASAPYTAKSFFMDQMLGDEVLDIAARERSDNKKQKEFQEQLNKLNPLIANGTLTEEEAFLQADQIKAQRAESTATVTAEERAQLDGFYQLDKEKFGDTGASTKTLREAAQASFDAQEKAKSIMDASTAATEGIKNETYGTQLDKALGETWKENSSYLVDAKKAYDAGDYGTMIGQTALGVANLVADGTVDLINNPAATLTVVAENLPYLALGAASTKAMTAVNIAYSGDIYSQAIEEYKLDHDGSVPSNSEARYMLAVSLTAGIAESLGNMKILSSIRKVPGLDKVVDGPAGKAMTRALEKVTSSKLLDNGIVRTAKAGVSSGAVEATTEMYQTMVEENFSRLNTDINGEDVFKAGILGGASGGIMAGTGRGVNEAVRGAADAVVNGPNWSPSERKSNRAMDEIADMPSEEDVTSMVDSLAELSPAKAAAALLSRNQTKGLSEEERATNLAKVEELTRVEQAKLHLSNEAYLAQVEKTGKDSKQAKKLYKELAAQNKVLSLMERSMEKDAQNELDKNGLAQMWQDLNNVEESPKRDKAARKLIGLAMKTPEVFQGFLGKDEETVNQNIKALTDNTSFTEEERTYFRNFSAAHAALNAAKTSNEVQENVIDGAPGFRGVAEFRSGVAAAIRKRAKSTADGLMTKLEGFSTDHLKKQAAHEQGRALLQEELAKPKEQQNKSLIYLVKPTESTGEWEITRNKPKDWNRQVNGGWELNISQSHLGASTKMISTMQTENTLLSTTAAELQSAIGLGFESTKAEPATADAAPVAAKVQQAESEIVSETETKPNDSVSRSEQEIPAEGNERVVGTKRNAKGRTNTYYSTSTTDDQGYQKTIFTFNRSDMDPGSRSTVGVSLEDAGIAGLTPYEDGLGGTEDGMSLSEYDKVRVTEVRTSPDGQVSATVLVTDGDLFFEAEIGFKPVTESATPTKAPVVTAEQASMDAFIAEEQSREDSLNEEENDNAPLQQTTEAVSEKDPETKSTAEAKAKPQAEAVASDVGAQTNLSNTEETNEQAASQSNNETEDGTQEGDAAQESVTNEQSEVAEAVDSDQNPQVEITDGALPNVSAEEQLERTLNRDELGLFDKITTYFTQRTKKDTDSTGNPLVEVEDFLGLLFSDGELNTTLLEMYLEDGDINSAQLKAIKDFADFRNDFMAPKILANVATKKTKSHDRYRYRDPIQFLRDDMPENVLTAISFAAYSWLADNGGQLYNDERGIKSIFGLGTSEKLDQDQINFGLYAGTRENFIIHELGNRTLKALGLQALKGAPANEEVQVALSLGAHALIALLQSTDIDGAKYDPWLVRKVSYDPILDRKAEGVKTENFGHPFITISQTGEGKASKPSSNIQILIEQVKGTKNVLNKLFGVAATKVAPTLDPEDYKQEGLRRSRAKVPNFMKKVLDYVAKRKYRPRMDMQNVRSAFDRTLLLEMFGKSQPGQYTQINLEESTRSTDDEIDRGLTNLESFETALSEEGEGFFYFLPSMMRTQRVRLAQNLVNPQDNKIHRFNIVMEEFRTEVDPSSTGEKTQLFKLAVAQGLGISVDKMLNKESMKEFTERVENKEFKQGIAIIQNILNGGTPDDAGQRAVAALVAQGGEKAHSLSALVDWAQYRTAEADGVSFETDIMFEVDGVTNGPAIAHFQLGLGAGISDMVGMYKASDPAQHFTAHKALKLRDMYEALSFHVNEKIVFSGHKLTEAVLYITGPMVEGENDAVSKDGRSLVKEPLTSLIFGSGVKKVVKNMSITFAHSFFTKLQKEANKGDFSKVRNSVGAINAILKSKRVEQLPMPKNFEDAMGLKFTVKQKEAVESAFNDVVGVHVTSVLDTHFSAFISRRNKLNEGGQALHARYKLAYDFLYKRKLDKKIEEGSVASYNAAERKKVKGKYVTGAEVMRPEQVLSVAEIQEIEEELSELTPFIHTAASKIDGDITAGMDVSKNSIESVKASDPVRSRSYTVEVKSAVGFPTEDKKRSEPKDKLSPRGVQEISGDPGVRPVILLTHAFDSLVAAKAYFAVASLNLYDALGMGLSQAAKGARELNKHFFEQMIEYSIPMEIYAALDRSFKGEAALVEKYPELGTLLAGTKIGIGNQIEVDQEFLESLELTAWEAERDALKSLRQVTVTDQYAMEGGSYTTEDRNRARIEERLKENADRAPVLSETKETEEASLPASSIADSGLAVSTPWGQLSVATSPENQDVSDYFNKGPKGKQDTKTLLPALIKIIKKNIKEGTANRAQLALVEAISSALGNKNIPVNVIYRDTDASDYKDLDAVIEEGWLDNARGLYTEVDGREAIWIRSDEFADSGFINETLLHEMTHAVVATLVTKYLGMELKKVPDNEMQAYLAVQELNAIYIKAKAFVEKNELESEFKPAIENLNEMIAWGMNNRSFQRDVLVKIEMPASKQASETFENIKHSGFKHFITNIASMLFKQPLDDVQNALGAMISNTGVLFSASKAKAEQAQENFGLPMKRADNVMSFTTAETFDALNGNTDGDVKFTRYLKGLLSNVTERAYAGGVLKAAAERLAVVEPEDVFLKTLDTGEAPFASLLQHRLNMSDQEAFVAESLEVALATLLSRPKMNSIQSELERIYHQAKKAIKKEDLPAGAWELLFNPSTKPSGRSDFLSQFAAAALAYKPLHDKLAELGLEADTRKVEGNLIERLILLVSNLLNSLAQWNTGTRVGERLNTSIEKLAERMATIEAERKHLILKRLNRPDTFLNTAPKKTADSLSRVIKKVANSSFIENNSVTSIKVGAKLAKLGIEDKLGDYTDFFIKISNVAAEGRLGLPGEIINEIRNGRDGMREANKLLDQMGKHEQVRKQAADETTQDVISSFHRKLTREEGEALTSIIMRAELSSLKGYTMAEIDALLSDRNFLEKTIKDMEQKITGKNRRYYLAQAKALGQNLMTGKNESKHLMLNAYAIAHLSGTGVAIEEAVANEAMVNLDPLITLYALRDSSKEHRTLALDVLREEAAREDGNGFERMISMHAFFQEQAKNTIFEGSEIQMRKGYVNETFNPHVQITAATLEMGKKLEQSGYKRLYPEEGPIPKDPDDISIDARYLYVVTGQGLGRHVTGIMSNSDMSHEGTSVDGESAIVSTGELHRGNKAINNAAKSRRESGIAELFTKDENWRPGKGDTTYMAPILNPKGEVVNYRYLMLETTKDVVLERRNNIEKVMGNIASSIIDKSATPKLNENAVDAFKAEYDKNYYLNQEAYIVMSANSSDPVIAERYRLLPKETQAYIRKVWGRNGMIIRKDVYNISFGYRKFSLGDAFEKNKESRKFMENVLVGVLGQIEIVEGKGANRKVSYIPSSKARWLVRSENAWEEIVKIVKDIVVIKNVFTLLGNQTSNMSIMALSGVPLGTMIKHTVTAIIGAHRFRKDAIQRNKLRMAITIDALTGDALQAAQDRIIELEESMETNPVKELVDAGMYQTLVEDLSQEEDPYTYKSKFMESAGKVVKLAVSPLAVIPGASAAGKAGTAVINNLFLTHDTAAYKFLNRATVMSDFSSRYVLYKHLTARRVNPLSKEDALHRARQAFVNYDVPSHKALQYLNDTGFIWFTKYYLRIQAVIVQLVRDNPLSALALIGANNLLFPISDILDSSALSKWPVNFGWGAGELLNVADEIAPINVALSIID